MISREGEVPKAECVRFIMKEKKCQKGAVITNRREGGRDQMRLKDQISKSHLYFTSPQA